MQTIIVIPCYNEAERLSIQSFIDFVVSNPSISFLFVNDGSSDNTFEILDGIVKNNSNLYLLNLEHNSGKAEAVRKGMIFGVEKFNPKMIGFWDADLATPLNEIINFIRIMDVHDFDVVTGLRLMRLGARVRRSTKRHYLGRVFATVASNILRLPVYDTQCGAKLYKATIVPILFEEKFITRWLFDVEILARYLCHFGYKEAKENIYEYPLYQWMDVGQTRLKKSDFFKAPVELLKIKRKYLNKK